jgi:starch phosphorylase
MPPTFPLLPPRIAGLAELACNLSWSWNRDARTLYRSLDEHLWVRNRFDPLALLAVMSAESLAARAKDPHFLRQYDGVMRAFEAERSSDDTWFSVTHPEQRRKPIAYFCAEFGVYHSVPIYSGGLGVLAGDHCKSASDLGVPLVGVGILYRAGYFDQRIRVDGWQEETDDHFDPAQTPLEPLRGRQGERYLATVRMVGRDVHIRAWRLRVGRVPIYLLDTDVEENHPDDRALLSKLYAGGPELRLRQEWLLGVGGVRVLRALGIEPAAWHANEGHVAFMFVERLRELASKGVALKDAIALVRSNSSFTTHTPVPAGHDVFPADGLVECAGPIWDELGVDRETFMRIGRHPAADRDSFHMTAAAIRLSRRVNAVSRSHAEVTRRIWAPLWPDRREEQVPIGHVTNGVHMATWMASTVASLLDSHLGHDWGSLADDPALWERVLTLDDAALWRTHRRLKLALLSLVREEARRTFTRRAIDASQLAGAGLFLDPEVLTLGFARRFATYKRANLMFYDVERLLRIVTDPTRPVQVIFAGKAHPADTPGKHVLQEVYRTTRDPRFEGRIAFVEDYDTHIAHVLVQGVDLWLNVPRVPLEASGTSGMKAALNGVPQLSTADGWWAEGYNGLNGWTVPTGPVEDDTPEADGLAAEHLYTLLENEVVPSFYKRDTVGLPRDWIATMKQAIRAGGRHFTARRMLIEYVRDSYLPSMLGDGTPDVPPTA